MKSVEKSKMIVYNDDFYQAQKAEENRRKAEHNLRVGRAVRSSRIATAKRNAK
ncbi:MAG: hypothetical protein ACLP9L_33375 [Thermoguttaceae bacterium]|jgi:hypothetical protein